MFKRCGLIESNISKREVLINLMHEGMRCLNKNDEFHRRNLLCYLEWCKDNNLSYLCKGLRVDLISHLCK